MRFLNLFRNKKTETNTASLGKGCSLQDPIKIPPVELEAIIKAAIPLVKEKAARFINIQDESKLRLAAIGLAKEMYTVKLLEVRYGKLGVDFNLGAKMRYSGGIIEQVIKLSDESSISVFFDYSDFK